MRDILKQSWSVIKYIFGFNKNFVFKDIENTKLFRYEIEYTRQMLLFSILEVFLFFGLLTLTINLLNEHVIIGFFVCLIEAMGCLFLFEKLLHMTKVKLQKKYDIREDD